MPYSAKIIADSISPDGIRLTTWNLVYPRLVHSELLTHRALGRNSSSSRAIPQARLRKQILDDPAMPVFWGRNQSGMQAREELTGPDLQDAIKDWLYARDQAVLISDHMATTGVHKQIANRVMEPWMYISVIVTATDWENWYHLRDHEDAQPEIAWVANAMHRTIHPSSANAVLFAHMVTKRDSMPYAADLTRDREVAAPTPVDYGHWHLPYTDRGDWMWAIDYALRHEMDTTDLMKRLSVARCARVSYLTHDGEHDPEKDLKLAAQLAAAGHYSPFDHVATPLSHHVGTNKPFRVAHLTGWKAYRADLPSEHAPEWWEA